MGIKGLCRRINYMKQRKTSWAVVAQSVLQSVRWDYLDISWPVYQIRILECAHLTSEELLWVIQLLIVNIATNILFLCIATRRLCSFHSIHLLLHSILLLTSSLDTRCVLTLALLIICPFIPAETPTLRIVCKHLLWLPKHFFPTTKQENLEQMHWIYSLWMMEKKLQHRKRKKVEFS